LDTNAGHVLETPVFGVVAEERSEAAIGLVRRVNQDLGAMLFT